jgi:hypothetical protein
VIADIVAVLLGVTCASLLVALVGFAIWLYQRRHGTVTLTTTSAHFTPEDVGRTVGGMGVEEGMQVVQYVSPTQVVLRKPKR